jgi:hypothetical protein
MPSLPITNPKFRYTPSHSTDIRETSKKHDRLNNRSK